MWSPLWEGRGQGWFFPGTQWAVEEEDRPRKSRGTVPAPGAYRAWREASGFPAQAGLPASPTLQSLATEASCQQSSAMLQTAGRGAVLVAAWRQAGAVDKAAATHSPAHLLSPRESVIEAGHVGHDGLLIRPQRAHNICARRRKKRRGQSQGHSATFLQACAGMQQEGVGAACSPRAETQISAGRGHTGSGQFREAGVCGGNRSYGSFSKRNCTTDLWGRQASDQEAPLPRPC